ncbi:MAG: hypothetical protein IT168_19565 [Bryobacterales bacterium]|nr:hypothetical protein [Bryobacterales bacterium]
MKHSLSATLLLVGTAAWAQTIFNPFQPLGQVKQFLQLTDTQLQTILTNNEGYNSWAWEKQRRIGQVQSEIVDESAKSELDPNALGIRYAEIETICREMKDKATEYRNRNLDVLNQNQKSKLKVLEDAIKLFPVIAEAQTGNLAGALSSAPSGFTSGSRFIGSPMGDSIFSSPGGCYIVSGPTDLDRAGDFTGSIGTGANPPNKPPPTAPVSGNRVPTRWFDTTTFNGASNR